MFLGLVVRFVLLAHDQPHLFMVSVGKSAC